MKHDIVIKRPDGKIPGLAAVNDELRKRFGVIVTVEVSNGNVWTDCYLMNEVPHGKQ